MKYAALGRSGLITSRLALGCMTFGEKAGSAIYKVDQAAANRIVATARDRGINMFDTSDLYSGGASETVLGAALKGSRHDILISSKVGFRTGSAIGDAGLSRSHVMASIDQTLKRLGTDYVDVYFAHKDDPLTPLDEILETFDAVVRAGKARYLGFSNWTAWRAAMAIERQRQRGLAPFVTGQIAYSLVTRDADYELLPMMAELGIGASAWSPLAGGMLTGKYDRASVNDPASRVGISSVPYDREQALDVVDVLRDVAATRGATPSQLALAWALQRPAMASAVIGVSRLDQLDDLFEAADLTLNEEEIAVLDGAMPLRPLYPHWHIGSSIDRVAYDALGRSYPAIPGGAGRGDVSKLATR